MRNFIDIVEASLPLYKGQMDGIRGNYGAFIVTMDPMDFLKLTTHDEAELKRIMDKPFPMDNDEYAEKGYETGTPGKFQMPFLNVEFPSGRVTGHEGRHRAAMIYRQGGKSLPVTIYPKSDTQVVAVLTYYDWGDDDDDYRPDIIKKVEFPSSEEAYAYIDELASASKKAKDAGDYDDPVASFARGKVEYSGGDKLKGAPDRTTDPWEPARWTKDDFPAQLVGQLDPSYVVDRSKVKVGLVKGYRHFRN